MSHDKHSPVSEFLLQGQFISFAAQESYRLKYLRLSTAAGEQLIKIPKELRLSLYRSLKPGEWIQVSGYRKVCLKKGTVKLKAYHIAPTVPGTGEIYFTPDHSQPSEEKNSAVKQTNILVCQKSDCCKRGGKALVEALQTELDDRGLGDQVKIKPTGCMKRCKAGPNLMMPDKTRYERIHPEEVGKLVDKHFPNRVAAKTV